MCTYYNVLSIDRHLGSFQFGAITNGAAVNILACVSWCSCIPVGHAPRRGIAGSWVCRCWVKKASHCWVVLPIFQSMFSTRSSSPLSPPLNPSPHTHILGSPYTKLVTILGTHNAFSHCYTSAPANSYHSVLFTLYHTLSVLDGNYLFTHLLPHWSVGPCEDKGSTFSSLGPQLPNTVPGTSLSLITYLINY